MESDVRGAMLLFVIKIGQKDKNEQSSERSSERVSKKNILSLADKINEKQSISPLDELSYFVFHFLYWSRTKIEVALYIFPKNCETIINKMISKFVFLLE